VLIFVCWLRELFLSIVGVYVSVPWFTFRMLVVCFRVPVFVRWFRTTCVAFSCAGHIAVTMFSC